MPFDERPEDVFLFDIEWIDLEAAHNALLPLYQVVRNTPPISPEAATAGKVPDFEKIVKEWNPTREWLDQALTMETVHGKSRAGVVSVIETSIGNISCPLPDKVAGMAEAVMPICMSWCVRDSRSDCFGEITQTWGELEVVQMFWNLCRTRIPCGYAIESADLPVILAATARLKGKEDCVPTASFDLSKGWGYLDVMKKRWGRNPNPCKLTDLAVAIGYKGDPDPLKDGSEVAVAHREGRKDDILKHNSIDVEKLRHVYKHYEGVLW